MSTHVYACTGIVFLIDQKMVIETTKKYLKEENYEKLSLMYQRDSEIINCSLEDLEDETFIPDFLEELRDRNDCIRRLD